MRIFYTINLDPLRFSTEVNTSTLEELYSVARDIAEGIHNRPSSNYSWPLMIKFYESIATQTPRLSLWVEAAPTTQFHTTTIK